MDKVLVAGASGALGFEVLKKLRKRNVPCRALVHSSNAEKKVKQYTDDVFVADIRYPEQLKDLCTDVGIIFSALGKSVSLFKPRLSNFDEIDFLGNKNIIEQAKNSGVKRFIYTSIMGSDTAFHLKVAKVHKNIQNLIEKLEIDYTIIKPVGFYTGLNDLVIMAKRGIIPVAGSGTALTNSIHPRDLAEVVMENLSEGPEYIEVGGPQIHTRNEMAEMIREKTNARIIHLPVKLIKAGLIPISMVKKSFADNINYFNYVTTHDMIAPSFGKITLKDYLDQLDLNQLP